MHQGHLYGLSGASLAQRINEILEKVGLAERADERVDLVSGGLRRRVELAKGLLHRPDLLLLDEPSTGVDLRARLDFWEYLRTLRRDEGVTVLLTTHLLDEAEECDRLAIIDRGSLVAEGTPAVLKEQIGGDVVALVTREPGQVVARLGEALDISATALANTVRFEHPRAPELIARVMAALPGLVDSVTVSHPSLDDVFVRVTGHHFEQEPEESLQR
jgi:ABC-2 type transport system ATP-binding protein